MHIRTLAALTLVVSLVFMAGCGEKPANRTVEGPARTPNDFLPPAAKAAGATAQYASQKNAQAGPH